MFIMEAFCLFFNKLSAKVQIRFAEIIYEIGNEGSEYISLSYNKDNTRLKFITMDRDEELDLEISDTQKFKEFCDFFNNLEEHAQIEIAYTVIDLNDHIEFSVSKKENVMKWLCNNSSGLITLNKTELKKILEKLSILEEKLDKAIQKITEIHLNKFSFQHC